MAQNNQVPNGTTAVFQFQNISFAWTELTANQETTYTVISTASDLSILRETAMGWQSGAQTRGSDETTRYDMEAEICASCFQKKPKFGTIKCKSGRMY